MARTGTAEKHQASQAALVSLIAAAIAHAWVTLVDPHDLKGSTPKLAAAVEALVTHYGRASAAHALTFYRNERRAAGVTSRPPRLPMPELPSRDEITATVEHALSAVYGSWSPEALAEHGGVSAPVEVPVEVPGVATEPPAAEPGTITPDDVQNAQDALASEVEQLVLDQSRQAIMDAAAADSEAKGWARVTEPGACSFCRLLATRGDAYTSKASADFRAHTKQPNGTGGTCRCHAEPVFNHFEPTAQARQDLADYQRLAEEYGHSGRDILIAWRQHVEGRPVTGPLTKPYTRSK